MKVRELVSKEIKFDKGQLYVIGGRCGMGKTSFAKNIALEMAKQKKRVAFFSLESSMQIVDCKNIKGNDESAVKNIDLFVKIPMTVKYIKRKCEENNYDCIVIDYLQLLEEDNSSFRAIVNELRSLADYLNIPVIILSQLGRNVEERLNHIPTIEDIDDIGLDSKLFDQVFLLYRDGYYYMDADQTKCNVIMKNEMVDMIWDYDTLSVQ